MAKAPCKASEMTRPMISAFLLWIDGVVRCPISLIKCLISFLPPPEMKAPNVLNAPTLENIIAVPNISDVECRLG